MILNRTIEYIDRVAVLNKLRAHCYKDGAGRCVYAPAMLVAMEIVRNAPELARIVPCRYCRYAQQLSSGRHPSAYPLRCRVWDRMVKYSDFCSHGELGVRR